MEPNPPKNIENKTLYTHKLADELLRYTRIRNFILGPNSSIPLRLVPLKLDIMEKTYNNIDDYENASEKEKYYKISRNHNTTFNTVKKRLHKK